MRNALSGRGEATVATIWPVAVARITACCGQPRWPLALASST